VQINRVRTDAPLGVVLAENVVARLAIVFLHLRCMLLAFLAEVVCARTVARLIRLVGAIEARTALRSFLAREIAQTVVFGFRVVIGMIEGCAGVNNCE
jgi:hypothetical protein